MRWSFMPSYRDGNIGVVLDIAPPVNMHPQPEATIYVSVALSRRSTARTVWRGPAAGAANMRQEQEPLAQKPPKPQAIEPNG
jgi:hypothetical protein